MLGDHGLHVAVAAEREGEGHPQAMQRWRSGAEHPQHAGDLIELALRVRVLGRLERDVVTEPLHLFVGIGVAANVDQQGAVVRGGSGLVIDSEQVTQAHRDPALAQHVFHRLAEPEVDPQRERREYLGQPHTGSGGIIHRPQRRKRRAPASQR